MRQLVFAIIFFYILAFPFCAHSSTYNDLNRMTKFAMNASPAFTWQNFSFDNSGNTTREYNENNITQRNYKWDFEGRLLEMTDPRNPGYRVFYTYDGMGRRLSVGVTNNGTTAIRRLVWCHMRLCQERDLGVNSIRRYLETGEYVNALGANPAQKLVYMQDQIGSVRDIVDADTGARVGAFDYTPYGTTTRQSGSGNLTSYRYGGLFWDGNIGQYLSVTRQYDPGTLRWLNRDFIREAGGVNLYGYSPNPIMNTDPMGHSPIAGAVGGAEIGTAIMPGIGTVIGGVSGAIIGGVAGSWIIDSMKPPENAKDPNGPKAPGKPSEAEGFEDPKGGEEWVKNPNPGKGGSKYGWKDGKGRVWCPSGQGGRAHGGAQWDVQFPGGGYVNVYPGQNINELP